MISDRKRERIGVAALWVGVVIPFLYFGIQIVAAFFYPGYSFLSRDASTLGSDGSRFPAIFNVGAIIVGIMAVIASWGFMRAFRELGINPIVARLTFLVIVSFGIGSINAGIFPLPDRRHGEGVLAFIGIGTIFLPLVIPAALWKLNNSKHMKIYFLINIVLLIALIPAMSGLIQIIMVKAGTESPSFQNLVNNYHGLLQRVFAFIAICPIGVGAYVLANCARRSVGNTGMR
jgi:glucan biosynthesis protein C